MSRRDIWAYNPDICDGDYCPMNCDHCPKRDAAQEANGDFDEPDDSQLEMGFDPDMGEDGDCSVWGLHAWYGRSIGYCPYFKPKKKEDE